MVAPTEIIHRIVVILKKNTRKIKKFKKVLTNGLKRVILIKLSNETVKNKRKSSKNSKNF